MSDEVSEESQVEKVVVKSKKKFYSLLKLKNKLPHLNKRFGLLIVIILAIPITVGIALVQQEIRSRASGGDRNIFLGINNGLANVDRPLIWVQADLERIKNETGAYPAVYVLWANLESNNPNLEVLRYLDSKGISPAISLMPRGREGFDSRRDGRFMLSASSAVDSVEAGRIKFNNTNPAAITKIFVSKTSSGTENPEQTLSPTWVAGQRIEIFGTNSKGEVDYESNNDFKFEIVSKTEATAHWTLSVRPIKTSPLVNMFGVDKPVFVTPSSYLVKKYSNGEIAKGSMDDKLLQIADVAKQFNNPIILRYAQEMNAGYYTWSDIHKKKRDKGGYRRYQIHDFGNKTGDFKSSWRYIYGKMKPVAPNLQFFWNPHNTDTDKYREYFPGDQFVDYVGFDAYSGSGTYNHNSLLQMSSNAISELKSISSKPIIIGETGINSKHSNGVSGSFSAYRKKWLTDGYNDLAQDVKGIMYFDVDMTGEEVDSQQANNWSISASPEIASAYRSILLNPKFQGRFGNRPPTPTPTLSPTPPPAAELPFGNHEANSCTNITGWACDENNYGQSVNVKIYSDAPAGEGEYQGTVVANVNKEASRQECGGIAKHGFNFIPPISLRDGMSHDIYVYAVDDQNPLVLNRLMDSPKPLSCAGSGPTPTPTPPDPTGCVRKLPVVSYKDTSKSGARKETLTYKITIKNNDVGCKGRKIAFDLVKPTTRWSYSPEFITLAQNETKVVDFKVTSGKYSSLGVKSLNLTISGAYRPHTIFSAQTLHYNVVR